MLRHVDSSRGVFLAAGEGERLPIQSGMFDLLTVSSAFHWLDRARFLAEAKRVLRHPGALVVYDHYFSGEAREDDDLVRWVYEVYRERYPAPPRGPVDFAGDEAESGFDRVHREEYMQEIRFTQEELIDYLLTQTNILAAVQDDWESLSEVTDWLRSELRPHFEGGRLTIRFCGPIWILRSLPQT